MPITRAATGMRFGRWTAIKPTDLPKKYNRTQWLFRCDCGTERITPAYRIVSGYSTSCGCAKAELCSKANITHGQSNSPEHMAWKNAKGRCYNPNKPYWHRYGGRGIKMAEEWLNNFQAFFDHIGPRPSRNHSLDRIDTDGDYAPGNVRWSTPKEQMNNMCRNVRLENGETIAQAARRLNVKYITLWHQLNKAR